MGEKRPSHVRSTECTFSVQKIFFIHTRIIVWYNRKSTAIRLKTTKWRHKPENKTHKLQNERISAQKKPLIHSLKNSQTRIRNKQHKQEKITYKPQNSSRYHVAKSCCIKNTFWIKKWFSVYKNKILPDKCIKNVNPKIWNTRQSLQLWRKKTSKK